MKHGSFIVLFFACALGYSSLTLSGAPPDEKTWLSYEPATVTLSGLLTTKPEYDPPGFGEDPSTDEKTDIYVLKLSNSINVRPDPHADPNNSTDLDTFTGVVELQVAFDPSAMTIHKFLGKKVRIDGYLYQATNGGQYTDILIWVNRIGMDTPDK